MASNAPPCKKPPTNIHADKKGIPALISTHKAATVKKGIEKYPIGWGHITKIEKEPYWRPTAYTRRYFAEKKGIKLPTVVPPGDKNNFLGTYRARLSHTVPGKGQIYCIHGNNDKTQVGKRVTGGCIRTDNDEGISLIQKGIISP